MGGVYIHRGVFMDHRAKLVALLLLWLSGTAFAGYAQLRPAAGWAANAYQAAANDASFINGIRSAAGLTTNVGGRAVTIPVAFRYAANAGSVAARAAFFNPAAIAAVAVGSAAYAWYQSGGYSIVDGVYKRQGLTLYEWKHDSGLRSGPIADPTQWWCSIRGLSNCASNPVCVVSGSTASCTARNQWGGTTTDSLTGISPIPGTLSPATVEQFEADHINLPIPAGLPQILPVPLPVEQPIINPSADPVPVPQPLRVPVGEPVPVPNTDPQQWRTPVVDIVPAPTPNDPWRVDLQPKDVTKTDPAPLPDSEPVPVPSPDTTETPTDKEVQDFCEKNPDVLACQTVTLGTLEPDQVADTQKDLSIDRGPSMGPSGGSCPAPKTVTVMGVTLSMPFTLLCQFAVMINPLLIGFAWLSAALTFFGLGRRES